MDHPENKGTEDSRKPVEKFKLPFWALGIGLIFPPAWPFLIIALLLSYPKTTAVVAGTSVAFVFGMSEMIKIEEKREQERVDQQQNLLLSCVKKYEVASKVPVSDGKCLSLLTNSENEKKEAKERQAQAEEREAAEEKERADSMANTTAEVACRKAVRESLVTDDGYNIPLGSVVTARRAGYDGQYVTKFPFSVKNAFGVRMKHAVECVATGKGEVVFVNQLF